MRINKNSLGILVIICLIIGVLVLCLFVGTNSQSTNALAVGEVYTDNPVITILHHGLGGSPLDWNNNGNFNYSRDSSGQFISSSFEYRTDTLIEQLRQKNENSNVYILSEKKNSFVDENNNQILSLTDTAISRYDILEGEYQRTTTTNFDFTKHVIIVYDSKYQESETFSTEIVFQRFKKVMNAVVDSYRSSHDGVYPKMNLIGHSRGTIINLLYATQYPDRIDSMFALGGLFNGTDIGRFAYLTQTVGTLDALLGGMMSTPFVADMSNPTYTNNMKTAWNNAVVGKSIKGYAISSGFDIEFLKSFLLNDDLINPIVQIYYNQAPNAVIDAIKIYLYATIESIQQISRYGITNNNAGRQFMDLLLELYNSTGLNAEQKSTLGAIFNEMVGLVSGNPVISMDGFLEESTQAAVGYNNFTRYYRTFTGNTSFAHRSQYNLGLPHNLETQDEKIIQYICSNINIGTAATYASVAGSIKRVNRVDSNLTTLSIPSTYDSQNITSLGAYSFSENLYGNNQITSVVIPASVTEIGFGAFQNCTNLTSVTFAPNSQLTTIYAYAFAGCTNLTSIDLPDSVTTIHEYAFANTGLTSCNLKNVTTLGYGVFSGCHSLTSFSKNSGNNSLTIGDSKVVYGSSSTQLLAYACGNMGTSFIIPNTVTIIGESAFKGANNLTSVTFSTSLAEVRFSSFENCTGLTNVELPGTVTDIGAFAFSGCYNLSSVRMFSTGNIAIGMGAFTGTDSVSFTVPQARISYYQSTEGLSPYASDVTAITYQISYVPYNGQTIAPTTVYYGVVPTIFNKNNLDPRVGYAVDGWYLSTENGNGTGTAFNASALYMTQGDTVLYARWVEMSPGNITYNANSNDATGTMTNGNVAYGGSYTISVCGFNLPGYECSGWATSANGIIEYNSGTEYTFYLTEGLTLYAVWTPVVYSIGYQLNNATGGVGNLRDYYTLENHYSFPAVSRTGYVFYGWVLVGNIDGMVLQNTVGFMQDITVRAEWEQTYQMGSSSPTTISATAVVLDFSGYSSGTSVNKEFTITRTVDSITLVNILNLKNLNFNINNSRGCRTKVIFDNVDFTGRASYPAIEAISVNIDIYVKSNSYVRGGSSTISNHEITLEELVYMPSAATFKHMQIFKHPESTYTKPYIAFYGGNGIDGTAGGNGSNNGNNTAGTNGGNGTDGCQGITALFGMGLYVGDNVKVYAYGGNGGKGGDGGRGGDAGNTTTSVGYGQVGVTGQYGGNGGRGGNGGHANHAVWILGSCTFSSDSYVYFRAGNGGAGGKGGNGGTGGKGGNGGDGKLGVHAARGGTGGDGGFGGNGGKGGNVCSSAFVCINQTGSCYNLGGTVGSGGSGGSGGAGGAGGRGGKKWPTNNYAETGYTGARGEDGAVGSSGIVS